MSTKQQGKQPEEKNTHPDGDNLERTENNELQAEIGQLTAREKNLSKENTEASNLKTGFYTEDAVEQLTADENNLQWRY